MRRRKADSLEVQQMKAQAREEKARKQVSKTAFELVLSPLGDLGLGGKEWLWADRSHLIMDVPTLYHFWIFLSWCPAGGVSALEMKNKL